MGKDLQGKELGKGIRQRKDKHMRQDLLTDLELENIFIRLQKRE